MTTADGKTPQEAGWTTKTHHDYELYGKSTKELSEMQAAQHETAASGQILDPVGGLNEGGWASSAAVYVWDDEYGDVGPEFPELEKQLFGGDHVRSGIAFEK